MTDEGSRIAELEARVGELAAEISAFKEAMISAVSNFTAQGVIHQLVFAGLAERNVISLDSLSKDIEDAIDNMRGAEGSEEIISALEAQVADYRDPEGAIGRFFRSAFGEAKQ